MKKIHLNVLLIEEGDTLESIQNWIVAHTDVIVVNLNLDNWVHNIAAGDLIIFDSPYGMYRFPAKVVKES